MPPSLVCCLGYKLIGIKCHCRRERIEYRNNVIFTVPCSTAFRNVPFEFREALA